MKDVVFKRQALAFILSRVLALLVVSASFSFHPVQASPYPTGTTETSGCATPLIPRENKFYMLSSQLDLSGNNTPSTQTNSPLNISAIDTNAHQYWSQLFMNFSPNDALNAFLYARNGVIYVSAGNSSSGTVAAYTANNGKKLWNIQLPADAQYKNTINNIIVGMAVCNNIVYIWKQDAIYAYNAQNGSLLWQSKELPSHSITYVKVTDTVVAFIDTAEESAIHALDAKKGTTLWMVNIPRDGHFVGLVLTATDKAVYVSQFNQDAPLVVEALSVSRGTLLWKTPVSLKPGNHLTCLDLCNIQPLFTQSLVANNIFYLSPGTGSGANGIIALNVNPGTYLWRDSTVSDFQPLQDRLYVSHSHAFDVCQVDPITGKSQWCYVSKFPENSPVTGMISDQTTVYIPMLDGIHALQKSNGGQKWIYKGNTSGSALMVAYGLSFDY